MMVKQWQKLFTFNLRVSEYVSENLQLSYSTGKMYIVIKGNENMFLNPILMNEHQFLNIIRFMDGGFFSMPIWQALNQDIFVHGQCGVIFKEQQLFLFFPNAE